MAPILGTRSSPTLRSKPVLRWRGKCSRGTTTCLCTSTSVTLSPSAKNVSSLCWITPRTHSTALQSTSCSIELLLTCNAGRLSRISVSLALSCCLLDRPPYPSRSATGSPSWVIILSQATTAATKRKTKEEGFDDIILQCTRQTAVVF